jgi:aryl-alcohol dehydrogenase-like predicted oxidoreductase
MFHDIDEDEGIQTVFAAVDAGINYIDVSPFYGITKAETVLGKALRQLPRDSYFLATKTGRFGQEEFDFSCDRITGSCEESLERLGVDHLDVLQLHDIEYQGGRHLEQALTEGIETLQKLRNQGKTRFIGVTAYPIEVLKLAMKRAKLDTVLCHNHYTLSDDQITQLMPDALELGVGLIGASPFGTSLLLSRGPGEWHLLNSFQREAIDQAIAFCRDHGTQIEKLAIQHSLSHDRIPTTLVSTANPGRLKQNITWLEETPDPELIRAVRKILAPIHNVDWDFGNWSGKQHD